ISSGVPPSQVATRASIVAASLDRYGIPVPQMLTRGRDPWVRAARSRWPELSGPALLVPARLQRVQRTHVVLRQRSLGRCRENALQVLGRGWDLSRLLRGHGIGDGVE